MQISSYKSILDGDRLPLFKKITKDKFILKLPVSGQYDIHKDKAWSSMWYVRDQIHNVIGYGDSLKKAILIVLKDYFKNYYNVYLLNSDPSLILCTIQYAQLLNHCKNKKISVFNLSPKKRKFLIETCKKINPFYKDEPYKQILSKIDSYLMNIKSSEFSTKQHILDTEDFSGESDYRRARDLLGSEEV